jgi:hypothetical protein
VKSKHEPFLRETQERFGTRELNGAWTMQRCRAERSARFRAKGRGATLKPQYVCGEIALVHGAVLGGLFCCEREARLDFWPCRCSGLKNQTCDVFSQRGAVFETVAGASA